jgi:SAM-dependent methyltransferase
VRSGALRRSLRYALLRLPVPVRRPVEVRLLRGYETYTRVRAGRHAEPREAGGFPVPPAKLRILVSGTADPSFFLDTGRRQAEILRGLYERHGEPLSARTAILDFGCGCGRLTRWWADAGGAAVFGCDPNPALVRWTQGALPFVRATVSAPDPPLPYPEASFDFVYALSIFTHLPSPQSLAWMAELRRVTRPGGLVLLTTAGVAYRERLSADEVRRYDRGEEVTQFDSASGTNLCIVYHPPSYVRERMLAGFELVEALSARDHPELAAAQLVQDCYLVRAPAR